jgi:hypothetical protein
MRIGPQTTVFLCHWGTGVDQNILASLDRPVVVRAADLSKVRFRYEDHRLSGIIGILVCRAGYVRGKLTFFTKNQHGMRIQEW